MLSKCLRKINKSQRVFVKVFDTTLSILWSVDYFLFSCITVITKIFEILFQILMTQTGVFYVKTGNVYPQRYHDITIIGGNRFGISVMGLNTVKTVVMNRKASIVLNVFRVSGRHKQCSKNVFMYIIHLAFYIKIEAK